MTDSTAIPAPQATNATHVATFAKRFNQITKRGNVIYHPHFDRPAVINPRIPGRKKGCISFNVARHRIWQKRQAKQSELFQDQGPVTVERCSDVLEMTGYVNNANYWLYKVNREVERMRKEFLAAPSRKWGE